MKTQCGYVLTFGLGLCGFAAFGHDRPVHFNITLNAAASAQDGSSGYMNFCQMVSPDCSYDDATNSLAWGSWWEDNIDEPGDAGGKRSMNHFYDPLTRLGLSNFLPDDRIAPYGRNSFEWASILYCVGIDFRPLGIGLSSIANVNTHNDWSWPSARQYEWRALTAATRSDRQGAFTNMFRAVGQVMHLLEDTTQPQHTRNEQHLDQILHRDTPWRSAIEDYGADHAGTLNYQHGMLNWRSAGFTRVEDFWNRGGYNGQNASALVADASATSDSTARLGLAEFSNGNFLAARHLFPEFSKPGLVDYYPFPSRDTSTDYNQVRANPSCGIDNFTFENGQPGRGIYLRKNRDGVDIPHVSRVNYLGAKVPGVAGNRYRYCTINDANVIHDYLDKLIPKAVSYSAGLIDYFFRGKIEASCAASVAIAGNVVLSIKNTSGQKLHGGSFQFFYDDAQGTRKPLAFSTTTIPPPASRIRRRPPPSSPLQVTRWPATCLSLKAISVSTPPRRPSTRSTKA
jgi:hypothetical protein